MSNEGEKSCPLCAEEMDLTDQQLKPCKCGYEICVWCWHHIMDMAEKDETEGRCPACRTPYNKEKIVGTAAKCERLVSEVNVEKKLKSQKGKSKTSEGRKQLGSVRVIQRNLVYVVGLPLNLADEDLLQRQEYFGQYGKVLKVSISRTTTGAIQQFANSTCSVYITYLKEEEAVRCIQSVHGFVLDGSPLRACFGTTKYCHAWLRNVSCSNPDCLYLHEIGSQEDSFTKDEIISAYTRSRIQQVTGASNSTQRRSGNVLPPPEDGYCDNSSVPSGKPIFKSVISTNNSALSGRISPPNSSSGRSTALPAGASWATRPSGNQLLSTSTPCSNGPPIKKSDMQNGAVTSSKAVASQVSSIQIDTRNKNIPNDESTTCQKKSKLDTYIPVKKESKPDESSQTPTTKPLLNSSNVVASSVTSTGPASRKDSIGDIDGDMENVNSDTLSLSIQENHQLQNDYIEHIREPSIRQTSGKAANTIEELCTSRVQSDFGLRKPSEADLHELEDDLLTFDSQRIKDPVIATDGAPDFSNAFYSILNISSPAFDNADGLVGMGLDRRVVDRNNNTMISTFNFLGPQPEKIFYNSEGNGAEDSDFFSSNEKRSLLGRYEANMGSGDVDAGESSIISNILSMDFDPWNVSFPSQDLAKLRETDRRRGSFSAPGSCKIQNGSQSRFSFAREEEPMSPASGFGQSVDYNEQTFKQCSFAHDFSKGNRLHFEKSGSCNVLPVFGGTETDYFSGNHSSISSNKLSVSKSQVSAPPGFSVPSRAAPPGFTYRERTEALSGNHILDPSSLLRNQYEASSSGNTFSNSDVEFIDPAILAVGKGTIAGGTNNPSLDIRSSFCPQPSTYEDERLQLLLQRSLPPHQNQRFNNPGDNFSTLGDAYGIPSRILEQTLSNNTSPFSQLNLPQNRNGTMSNGQWDGWTRSHIGNNLGMAELLRTEQLGLNKFYSGYDEPKIRLPTSGNLYNGAYGI